jgi:uncharacterized membrane protein YhaH (DUF805 family)
MQWYTKALKNYFNFSGRARRKEYWMYNLIYFLLSLIAVVIDTVLGNEIVTTLFLLLHFIPSLSITFRRLHDSGKSAWWLLLGLIPLVGSIIILVFLCMAGEDVENKYGDNPKAA